MNNEVIEFKNIEELYKRVGPALYSKCLELRKIGMKHVSGKDIWLYLIDNVWKDKKELELSDMVSDILFADPEKLDEFVSNKILNSKEN